MRRNEATPARRRRKRAIDPVDHDKPSSDQAPGEEVVQVNDAYRGGGPPPEDEAHQDDEQHPTGG